MDVWYSRFRWYLMPKKHLWYVIDVEHLEHSLSNMSFDQSGMYMLIVLLHHALHWWNDMFWNIFCVIHLESGDSCI